METKTKYIEYGSKPIFAQFIELTNKASIRKFIKLENNTILPKNIVEYCCCIIFVGDQIQKISNQLGAAITSGI